ncbi:hypothetical protein [Umezawaea beigongshangensis]|uniref:hypothetical protein n=1 Tax=Umezawaea beigongshangensis TaxID=2780383 RepID=UPI0018F1C5D9|nr:hypothetical protein [Umezawaea beigongshangensis]
MPTEKERLDALEPVVAEAVSAIAALNAELGRVSGRLRVLESRLSGAGAGEPADFDAVDEVVAPVIAALRTAWDAEDEVLGDEVRTEKRELVAEFDRLEAMRVDLAGKLDSRRLGRFDREQTKSQLGKVEWRLGALRSSATEARSLLEDDEQAAGEMWRVQAVHDGDEAREQVQQIARVRVEEALRRGAELPTWFRVGVGEIATPDPTNWLRAAAAMVAYRLEYNVGSAVSPLGPPPADRPGSIAWQRQMASFKDISAQFTALRP